MVILGACHNYPWKTHKKIDIRPFSYPFIFVDFKDLWGWDSIFLWIAVFLYLIKSIYLKGTSHQIRFSHKFKGWKDFEIGLGLWTEKKLSPSNILSAVKDLEQSTLNA